MEAEVGKARSAILWEINIMLNLVYINLQEVLIVILLKKPVYILRCRHNQESIKHLFVNDMSSARPEGSMEVKKVYWFIHPNKLGVASSAKDSQFNKNKH